MDSAGVRAVLWESLGVLGCRPSPSPPPKLGPLESALVTLGNVTC